VGGGAAGSESDVNKDKEKDLELSLYSFTCIAWGNKYSTAFLFGEFIWKKLNIIPGNV
jgi:hypothetical protein